MRTISVRWVPFTVLQVRIADGDWSIQNLALGIDHARRLIHPDVIRAAQARSGDWIVISEGAVWHEDERRAQCTRESILREAQDV